MPIQLTDLKRTEHVARLVQRRVAAVEGAPHLARRTGTFVAHAVDEKIDALLRRPFAEVEFQREDDPRAAMRPPKKGTHPVLGCRREFQIPQMHLPPKRPPLDPEGSRKQFPMLVRTRQPVELQMMAGHQFVKHRRPREMAVVRPQALHFLLLGHRLGRIRHEDVVATEEERRDLLLLRRHHLEQPDVGCERWHGDEVVRLHVVHRFQGEIAHQRGLRPGLDVILLHLFERCFPVVSATHLPRRPLQLGVDPRKLALGDRDQFLRRVGDHFAFKVGDQPLATDRIADHRLLPRRRVDPDDLLAQELAVIVHRRRELLVRIACPPTEYGIVAVEGLEPLVERLLQLVEPVGRPKRDNLARHQRFNFVLRLADLALLRRLQSRLDRGPGPLQRLGHRFERGCGGFAVDRLESTPRLLEMRHLFGKRQQRRHLVCPRLVAIDQSQFVREMRAEQCGVDPAFDPELVVGDRGEFLLPRHEELAAALRARRRPGYIVEAIKVVAVGHETLDELAQFARVWRRQRGDVRHVVRGRTSNGRIRLGGMRERGSQAKPSEAGSGALHARHSTASPAAGQTATAVLAPRLGFLGWVDHIKSTYLNRTICFLHSIPG